nr:tetratricopeptide repeat protein [Ktedonobacteraceae bacterium]
ILDNLESITGSQLAIQHTLPPEEQAALRDFLAKLAKGNTLVLLGSRSGEDWLAKGTFEENVYDLRGLDEQAASMLVNRILERYEVTQYREGQHVESLQKLIKVLDGYPLALEVVLANLRHQTPERILEALQAGDVRVDIVLNDEQKDLFEQKTKSILRCIEYSFSNLSPEAQQLLLCLAPFTSVVWLERIDKYTERLREQPVLKDLPFQNWLNVLIEAQNWGLLRAHETVGFLKLQPIFPYFLRSRLNEPARREMREAIETAFRQHYDELGALFCQLFSSTEPQRQVRGQVLVGLEYENVSTALKLALEARVAVENLYLALSRYLTSIQDVQRGFELGVSVLQSIETYPPAILEGSLGWEIAEIIGDVATKYFELKNYAGAKIVYQRLLEQVGQIEQIDKSRSNTLKAGTYHQLGRVAEEQQEWKEAEQHYQQAIEVFRENNDGYSQGDLYYQLGTVAQKQKHWQEADKYYQQALQIYGEYHDRRSQGYIYHQLGMLAGAQGNWKIAMVYYQKALQIKGEYHDWHSQASTYNQLGILCRQQRWWKEAEDYYQKALQIYIGYNDRFNQARIYNQLGNVAGEQKDWEEATNYWLKALENFKDYPEDRGIDITLNNLRSIWIESGNEGVLTAVAHVLQTSVESAKERMLHIAL